MPNLIVLTGLRKGTVLSVERPLLIGRSIRADLRLPDFLLSQEHARLEPAGDGFVLKDLASTNGTFKNGTRVHASIELELGDVIHLGSTDLLFTDRDTLDRSLWLKASSEVLGESATKGELLSEHETTGATPTVMLPLVHAVERAFSRAEDLSGLLERVALNFARNAQGTEVEVALRRGEGGPLTVLLRASVDAMEIHPEATPDPEPSPALLAALESRKSFQVEEEVAGKRQRVVYSVLPSAQAVAGVVRVGGLRHELDTSTLAQLDLVANLAGVYCRNHLLLEELVSKNAALEAAQLRLESWNEELRLAVAARTEALERSMRSYRELFEESQDGNFTVDPAGMLESVNRRAAEILEIAHPPASPLSFGALVGEQGREALMRDCPCDMGEFGSWVAALDRPCLVTFPLAGSDPERAVELLVQRRPGEAGLGLHCVVRDVTYRFQTEARMRLLSQVVESVPTAVVTMDPEGVVTTWNPSAEALYGYLASDVLGELTPLVPDEYVEEFERLLDAARQGQSVTTRSARVDRDDRVVQVETTVAPIVDEAGGVSGVVEITRDLGHQLELEERIRWKERMASFGELAAGLAHELGNPLANLLSGVGLLLDKPRPAEETASVHRVLYDEIKRLQRLVRQTLTLARWQAPDSKPESAVELLDFVAEAVRPRALEQGVEVIREDAAPLEPILADSDQIKQALVNLASNALEAMEQGGRLRLSCLREGERIAIEVADTGSGIKPADLPKIFDLYFSRRLGGSGIGLSIVKRIVEAHQGRIDVESELGRGTTFRLLLPIDVSDEREEIS